MLLLEDHASILAITLAEMSAMPSNLRARPDLTDDDCNWTNPLRSAFRQPRGL
jgi:hypothetical protein